MPASADMVLGGYGVSAEQGHPLRVFGPHAQGTDPAYREIAGPSTLLWEPVFGVYEPGEQVIYVADFRSEAIRVYPAFASGDVAPVRILNAPMGQVRAAIPIPEHQELVVITHNCCLATYPIRASGPGASPVRRLNWGGISGSQTQLNNPFAPAYLPDTDEYAVIDSERTTWEGKILFHARTASGNAAPTRVITGPNVRDARGLAHDPATRRLFVLAAEPADPSGNVTARIDVYADTASGNAIPLHSIAGPSTQLLVPPGEGFNALGHDPYTNRLMVTTYSNTHAAGRVIVLSDTAEGNATPVQVLYSSSASPYVMGTPFAVPAEAPDGLFHDDFEGPRPPPPPFDAPQS